MNHNRYLNWIHLDLKGMIPSEARLCQWLKWIRDRGFSGIVFEYEDRISWATFPGTHRPGFSLDAWGRIWDCCEQLGLEVIPLIQTFGHLEWLLKHETWSRLCCAGHVNLLCPENVETRELLEAWINEVARLHPNSPFIHVGLDEVYHMGACPACKDRAAASSYGNMDVLYHHSLFVCEAVIRAGKRPIMWADMFLGEDRVDLLAKLPPEVIICDWKYREGVGLDTGRLVEGRVRDVMGASAIRCAFPTYCYLVDLLQARLNNISQWHEVASNRVEGGLKAVIHTVWGRSRGLSPLYGPWEGWLPAFEAAAKPGQPLNAVLSEGMALLEHGLKSGQHHVIEAVSLRLQALHSEDRFEEQALRWWELALRHYAELFVLRYRILGREELRAASSFQGSDPDLALAIDEVHSGLVARLAALEKEIRCYLEENQWSDCEEYMEERIGPLWRTLHCTL